jgi:hypothetical protein
MGPITSLPTMTEPDARAQIPDAPGRRIRLASTTLPSCSIVIPMSRVSRMRLPRMRFADP